MMRPSRRELLRTGALGFGWLALADMLAAADLAIHPPGRADPLAPRPPHFPARAKRVIFLFMHGGPSQVDTFDYKPRLHADDGKPLPFAKPRVVSSAHGQPARGRRSSSSNTARAGRGCRSCSRTSRSASTTCASSSRCTASNSRHGGALLELHTG